MTDNTYINILVLLLVLMALEGWLFCGIAMIKFKVLWPTGVALCFIGFSIVLNAIFK